MRMFSRCCQFALALAALAAVATFPLAATGKPTRHFPALHAVKAVPELGSWLSVALDSALDRMLSNIQADGAVAASPSGSSPADQINYWYHWVRDAALIMDTVLLQYSRSRDDSEKRVLEDNLWRYAAHESRLQNTVTLTGLGEPKFNIDGSAFNGPWGRPQNDGAALRATTLTKFALAYLVDGGSKSRVLAQLYDGRFPSQTVIKRDLEYVAAHIYDPSFDLWEEVFANNFFTRMVQRQALLLGAKLASLMDDDGAAKYYRAKAAELTQMLARHLDQEAQVVREHIDRRGGINWKTSNLDIAAILAVVYTHQDAAPPAMGLDAALDVTNPLYAAHLDALEDRFAALYPINHDQTSVAAGLAPGIGRYPEDRYNGAPQLDRGNPWFLATNVAAEFYYLQSRILCERAGASQTLNGAKEQFVRGDAFLRRTARHQDGSFRMAEQFDANSGFMCSARDLTWSYASLVRAGAARERALECFRGRF